MNKLLSQAYIPGLSGQTLHKPSRNWGLEFVIWDFPAVPADSS